MQKSSTFLLLFLSLHVIAQQEKPVFVLNNPEGHYADIFKIHVTADQSTAITLGRDKSMCIWDIPTETLTKKVWLDMGSDEKGKLLDWQ